jgi:predicted permease
MTAVLAGVAPVFLLIALGYGLKASGFMPAERWGPIERLAIWVLYPGFLIPAVWQADLSGADGVAGAAAAITAVLLVGGAVLVAKRWITIEGPSFCSVFQGAIRWNGFVFLPVVSETFGPQGLALAAVVFSLLVPTVNVICVAVHARWGEGQRGASPRAIAVAMAKNPILVACAVGAVLNLVNAPPLPALSPALDLLGDAALPLGLIVAGAGLSFRYVAARKITVGAVAAVKLLLMPVLMLALARLYGGSELVQGVVLACGAAPGAAASYVLARQMGGDAPLIAGVTAVTTVASAATIPLLLTLARLV